MPEFVITNGEAQVSETGLRGKGALSVQGIVPSTRDGRNSVAKLMAPHSGGVSGMNQIYAPHAVNMFGSGKKVCMEMPAFANS